MSEYWKRRSEAILIANEKSLLQYEKELKKAYEATILNLKKEVEAFYARYANDNRIDLATARQRLNTTQLKDFRKQAQLYLDEIDRLGLDPKYKEYLRKLSAKAYITKLQEIETNIRHEIEKISTQAEKGLEKELKNDYEDSFYKTLFEVQKQAGFGIGFTTPGTKQLDTAIRTKWLGGSFSDRIWSNKNALLTQLNQIIPQEFVRGRGPNEVAKTLSDKLGTSFNNAVRLARTEINNISNQATHKAYVESGIVEEYEFLATLDNRTSEICRELDGKVFKLSEAQTGINLPPMHPYCRSTTVPHFPEDEFSEPSDRIARDETGDSYLVGKSVTYKEWVENYAEASYVNRKYKTKV